MKDRVNWILDSMNNEGVDVGELNYIFCDDDYLLLINRKYLQHDYYTDVIGFDYSTSDTLSGDIFISVDRVKENAERNNVSFENELSRVMIHGVLHFVGYSDKLKDDKMIMTSKEDYYINLLDI